MENNIKYEFDKVSIWSSVYRPFCKQNLVYEKQFLQRTYQQFSLFPSKNHSNLVICVSGVLLIFKKKVHPIILIVVSAVLGIAAGYIGKLF